MKKKLFSLFALAVLALTLSSNVHAARLVSITWTAASTAWVAPNGITQLLLQNCYGSGGSGGSGDSSSGAGTGGGAGGGALPVSLAVTVTPGTSYTVTIGAAPNGGTAATGAVGVVAAGVSEAMTDYRLWPDKGPLTISSVHAVRNAGDLNLFHGHVCRAINVQLE